MDGSRNLVKDAMHLVIFVGLIVALLGLLTWTGVIKCGIVPGWCNIYWGVMSFATGGPKVLIVYGDGGLGNPVGGCDAQSCSLREILASPEFLGVHADSTHIDRVNTGNLLPYHMVIVESARKIPTKTLHAFIDYYNAGGRLVWTGDAGVELGEDDELLYFDERQADTNDHIPIGPWARKLGNEMVSFDHLLSVSYVNNYCEMVNCLEDKPVHVGNLEPEPSMKHPLIRGIASSLQLWVFKGQDFAVVETIPGGITTEAWTLEYGSNLIDSEGKNYGRTNPMIVASGIGERVVYYSMPPELYANPKLSKFEKGIYLMPLRNMYYGILQG